MKKTTGISLMLLIFLSLCLITFSLLSLSGATADRNLSRKAADRTTEYYAAVTTANEILAEIDFRLSAALKEAIDSENPKQTYIEACKTLSISEAELTWEENDDPSNDESLTENSTPVSCGSLSYDAEITEDQYLHVVLSIIWPEEDSDTLYQITSWKVVSVQEWSADTSQNLYQFTEN